MITKRGKTPSSLDKHVRGRTTASACDLKGTAKGDYSGLISGDSFRISDLFVSSDTTENIKRAMKYRRDDELVQQIVNTKLDFLVAGFRNHCTNADALGFYNQLCLEHEFDSIITELADDMLTTDNAILHWKVDDGGKIEYIMTLNPSFVKYSNAMGQEKLELVLDEDMRKSLVEIKKSQNLSIPKKYDGSSTTVELRNADGEYWQVLSVGGRRFTSLVKPSMAAVFADLRLRNLFVDGDWSTAFFAKAFIQLIKSGESIDSGPLAGSKRNWQTKKENTELNNLFRDVSRALRVVGNHTLTVEHIVPPKEAYAEERYTPVETRIFRWGGMPKVVIEGSGGQYASGFIGKTKLIADIRRKRMILARFLEKFYRHPTINGGQFDDTPKVRFN